MTQSDYQPSELTVVCHVRAPLLLEPVDSKIETLRTCEDDGEIGDLLLRSWPDSVSVGPDSPHQEVLERFERFEQWADAHDVSVEPPFRIRTASSLASDEPTRMLVTPILCLALYHADQLIGVYPHTDGEETYTTTDAIAKLRTGAIPTPLGTPAGTPTDAQILPTPSSEEETGVDVEHDSSETLTPTICPSCDEPLVNVQGILACTDCLWTDSCLNEIDSSNAKLVYLSVLNGPVSVEALQQALDLSKIDLYGITQTLVKRDLIERTESGAFRASRRQQEVAPAPGAQ